MFRGRLLGPGNGGEGSPVPRPAPPGSLRGAGGQRWGHGRAELNTGGGIAMPAPEPMPGYGQLLKRGYGSLTEAIKACGDCGWELSRRTWTENAYLGWGEVLLCGLCALGWTVLRRAAARRLFGVSPYRRGGTGTGGGGTRTRTPRGRPWYGRAPLLHPGDGLDGESPFSFPPGPHPAGASIPLHRESSLPFPQSP